MTERDHEVDLAGYYPSAWPAECAGPRRQKVTRASGLRIQPGERLRATSRSYPGRWPVMFVHREPGELYLQGGSRGGHQSHGWVEQLDPVSLEVIRRSERLPSGGHNWCGAIAVHANGDLYVVNGRFAHRLSPALEVLAERELPIDNAYNGHVILSDGNLVTKDIQSDPSRRSGFTVLDPELNVVAELELPENSVGRFSCDRVPGEDHLYVTSPTRVYRLIYRDQKLEIDPSWLASYDLPGEDQSFAWDSCLGDDSVWLMDMGENAPIAATLAAHPVGSGRSPQRLAPLLIQLARRLGLGRLLGLRMPIGQPLHSAPQHVFRFSTMDAAERDVLVPFGIPGGNIFAPPLFDPDRRILVAFDTMNAKFGAWRYEEPGRFTELWRHDFLNSSQPTLYADTGELLVDDVRLGRWDAVVLDVETGREKGRANTGCGMSGGMWYTPGFGRDFYTSTGFGGIARVYVGDR